MSVFCYNLIGLGKKETSFVTIYTRMFLNKVLKFIGVDSVVFCAQFIKYQSDRNVYGQRVQQSHLISLVIINLFSSQ